jgi:hypothetical protein
MWARDAFCPHFTCNCGHRLQKKILTWTTTRYTFNVAIHKRQIAYGCAACKFVDPRILLSKSSLADAPASGDLPEWECRTYGSQGGNLYP